MRDVTTKRLRFTTDADTWLKVLKQRTGLNPNIICRVGLCLSLAEPGIPPSTEGNDESTREINRFTLLGEYDSLFVALLRQRLQSDGDTIQDMDAAFRDHVHRGVNLMSSRVRSIADIVHLIGGQVSLPLLSN